LGELPPLPLLRDGLLMLEGGGSASESQRTLLLRAALAYDRGVQTALRHQVDAERVALVVAEALVEWEEPLEAERLPAILGDDEQVQMLLIAELDRSRVLLTGEPRRRAQLALEALPKTTDKARKPISPPPVPAAALVRGRRPLRQILLLLLLVALVGFVLWQQRQRTPEGMIAMPAATYALLTLDGGGAATSVALDAFFIDRFEVTNRDYRGCVEAGACAWPLQPNSATRKDYFTNPAFDGYPVVNVTQVMAAAYCAWQDKRLPSAGEWQATASVSPTTGQFFHFPWGQNFEAQRTNSADTGGGDTSIGDTMVVGSFRPAGDSPSGAADMAGNVAEWTTTLVPGSEDEEKPLAIVKGGSFASDADAVTVYAGAAVEVTQALPEVGFRCARSHLLTPR
jgi:formylglycine-generating enzyme required for sulfatase activity